MKSEAGPPSAVVTGASTGIGRAVAKRLVDEGWQVFAGVRREADGCGLVEELGERLVPLMFDVTDEPAVRQAAEEVAAALGGRTLSGLVNNAGVAFFGALGHLDTGELRRQLEANLFGVHTVTRELLPVLGLDLERRAGRPETGEAPRPKPE